MNINTLRLINSRMDKLNPTPGRLTNGRKDNYNIEGLIASCAGYMEYGDNRMLSPNGEVITGTVPFNLYSELGLTYLFPSEIVLQTPFLSNTALDYFSGFEFISWLMLDSLDIKDLQKVIYHLENDYHRRFIAAFNDYTLGYITLNEVFIGYLTRFGRDNDLYKSPASIDTKLAMQRCGLPKLVAKQIFDNRYRLELTQKQLELIGGGRIDLNELEGYYKLTREQVTELMFALLQLGHYSPLSCSKRAYYLKEMEDLLQKNPQSIPLNNGIILVRRYQNLPPQDKLFYIDTTEIDDEIKTRMKNLRSELDAGQGYPDN